MAPRAGSGRPPVRGATTLAHAAAALAACANRFDADGLERKRAALQRLAATPLAATAALVRLHDALLFVAAHPSEAGEARLVEAALARIGRFLRRLGRPGAPALVNHGLPFCATESRFSHDGVRWLLAHPHARVAPRGAGRPQLDLNGVLRLTLPSLEREQTTAGLADDTLLDALRVRPRDRLAFLVGELARLDREPYLKDHLFDALDQWVTVTPTDMTLSKAGNRLPVAELFHHDRLLRHFDVRALLDSPLPPPRALDGAALDAAVRVIKNTMLLTVRETDPATYLDPRSLRVFDLERGLTVAIFGMTPGRQLPLESYVGFTLFKNGLPAAYGGSWILGRRANFGMNIFEPFRGGESGLMMCQVLRTYRQAFRADFFEVDAHQFGLDNPDGIASGAFWFYHRYGFRPLDPRLAALAACEKARIARHPGARSDEQTLRRFTASNVALNLGRGIPPQVADFAGRVTRWVARYHRGDRAAAEAQATARFVDRTALDLARLDTDRARVLAEVALIAAALPVDDERRLALLAKMIDAKPVDAFAYQALLLEFLDAR